MKNLIKPLVKQERSFASVRRSMLEANNAEDSDLLILPENPTEKAPICTDEWQLRYYIRTAKIKRKITHLFVHCTATYQNATVTGILNYWKNNKGWKNVGYHVLLPKKGFTTIADFDQITNGVKGYNYRSVHISYIGGIDDNRKPFDNRTDEQKRLINAFIEEMVNRFPNIKVLGHNEASNKACPCFHVKDEYPNYYTGK